MRRFLYSAIPPLVILSISGMTFGRTVLGLACALAASSAVLAVWPRQRDGGWAPV